MKRCASCGGPVPAKPKRRIFCCRKCKERGRPKIRYCRVCNKPFPWPWISTQRYCSIECQKKSWEKKRKQMKAMQPMLRALREKKGLRKWGMALGIPKEELILRAAFPDAVVNYQISTGHSSKWEKRAHLYSLDLAWPELKLDVEID